MCLSRPFSTYTLLVSSAIGVLATGSHADVTVSDFNSFNLSGTYASWTSATLTSGPDSYGVSSSGFGGGFFDISPNLDATGEATIELDVIVTASDPVAGLGIVFQLVDEDLSGFNYTQFGLLPGPEVQTLTWDITAPNFIVPGDANSDNELNTEDLSFFHLQIDPGASPDTYEVAFEDLRLVSGVSALTGDYNGDGFVSQPDLDLVLLNWGDSTAPEGFDESALDGGGPFDGLLSQNELDGVLLNWGNGTAPTVAAIPEPSVALISGLLGVMVWGRRRP